MNVALMTHYSLGRFISEFYRVDIIAKITSSVISVYKKPRGTNLDRSELTEYVCSFEAVSN